MNFLASLFSSGAATLVDSVMKGLDGLFTSDEEREKVKVVLETEMNSFRTKQLAAIAEYDKEITTRHATDMKSDSWLSKNIRPLVLAFLTFTTMLLAYLSIFLLPVEKSQLIEPWISLLVPILITVYAFYFGSRGIEKVQNLKRPKE